jgi:cadmium resistance protein CadD (predicted permease)
MIGHLLLAISTFIVTNVDDLLILSFYFASRLYTIRSVVLGQYLGIILLIVVSLAGLFFRNIIPNEWVGLLGIFPIIIGVKELMEKKEDDENELSAPPSETSSGFWKIMVVTIANGGDNIGVYTPLFIKTGISLIHIYVITFLVLTGLMCYVGYYFVNHPRIKHIFARYGSAVMPHFLIGLGLVILSDLFF